MFREKVLMLGRFDIVLREKSGKRSGLTELQGLLQVGRVDCHGSVGEVLALEELPHRCAGSGQSAIDDPQLTVERDAVVVVKTQQQLCTECFIAWLLFLISTPRLKNVCH